MAGLGARRSERVDGTGGVPAHGDRSVHRRYAGCMNKTSIWTIVGVVVAAIIAWFIVSALFSLLWFVVKLALVVVVAVVVYLVLRGVFSKQE